MGTFERDTFFPLESEVPPRFAGMVPVEMGEYLEGGEVRTWTGPVREVCSPVWVRGAGGISAMKIGHYPLLGPEESLLALAGARRAFDGGRGSWAALDWQERADRIDGFASGMEPLRETVAGLLMWETGKTYSDSLLEFDRTLAYIRAVTEAVRREPASRGTHRGLVASVSRLPLGVVLSMGPFNYPLFETFTGIISALVAGNSVIFKTPRFGTLLFRPLLPLLARSFPAGVINEISGAGRQIVPPLLSSGMVDGLAFIGTSGVAAYLTSLHPKPLRLVSVLGLEAKNPAILLADADMEGAAAECVHGALSFNGQRCAALKIFFVPRPKAEAFLEAFHRALSRVRYGMPWEDVLVTPLTEPGKGEYLSGLVEDAAALGAQITNEGGGERTGTFFAPAVLYPVTDRMRVFHEEQFGPLVPVVPYDDLDEVLGYLSQSNYGQQASLFGGDTRTLSALTSHLVHHVSRVNINCQCQRSPDQVPFSGRKDSGLGSLATADAPYAFSVPSVVAGRDTPLNRRLLRIQTE